MRTLLALLVLALPAAAQGTSYNYCQANPNSFGTTAYMGYTGSLDLSVGDFTLTVDGCPPNAESWGMFTCGQAQYNVPFGAGYLCVKPFNPGIHRMSPQALLPGTISRPIATSGLDASLFQPASSWNFQFWYRDPNAGGTRFNLSDGLHVEFAP